MSVLLDGQFQIFSREGEQVGQEAVGVEEVKHAQVEMLLDVANVAVV